MPRVNIRHNEGADFGAPVAAVTQAPFWPLLHRTDGILLACDRKHLWLGVRVPCRNVNRVPLALPSFKD